MTVDVYFQTNAWVDTTVAVDWAKRTLKPFVKQEKLDRHVLFADNLTAQVSEDFKHEVSSFNNGVVWFGLPGVLLSLKNSNGMNTDFPLG